MSRLVFVTNCHKTLQKWQMISAIFAALFLCFHTVQFWDVGQILIIFGKVMMPFVLFFFNNEVQSGGYLSSLFHRTYRKVPLGMTTLRGPACGAHRHPTRTSCRVEGRDDIFYHHIFAKALSYRKVRDQRQTIVTDFKECLLPLSLWTPKTLLRDLDTWRSALFSWFCHRPSSFLPSIVNICYRRIIGIIFHLTGATPRQAMFGKIMSRTFWMPCMVIAIVAVVAKILPTCKHRTF